MKLISMTVKQIHVIAERASMVLIISHANANRVTLVNCVKHKSTNVNRTLASSVDIAKI